MPFCPICGSKLSEGELRCPSCGAGYEDMRGELREWMEGSSEPAMDSGVKKSAEGRCIECGSDAVEECFFCSAPICSRHSYPMRIHSMNVGMGETVNACFVCAGKMEGETPSKSDAERVGIYFNVKPYYQWKRV